eukprot:CAMPEP_0119475966 /NCGR_PEP_ID=MMETSP1344-20130328/6670_1 /TAXON_ID=236787 /ORGANISM="Florenciella parvula, Strain CCMP2471" /LENGTH=196 /DNA_ID=CAMNT_0007509635 /DNA_START=270 /DNA_END=859 /DNA_ORIENTATION=+
MTALMCAVWGNKPGVLEQLIAAGVGLDVMDNCRRTAVEHAAGGGHISKGRPECLKLLIAAGADVNLQAGTPASQAGRKFSALMQAARYGNVECVELLIAAGADLNVYAMGYVVWHNNKGQDGVVAGDIGGMMWVVGGVVPYGGWAALPQHALRPKRPPMALTTEPLPSAALSSTGDSADFAKQEPRFSEPTQAEKD